MKDFYERLHLAKRQVITKDGKVQNKAIITTDQMVNLIKAGCFDALESDKTRLEILEEFLHLEFPDKVGITTGALKQLIKRGLIPDSYSEALRYYHFREYLKQGEKVEDGILPHTQEDGYKVVKSKKWYLLDGEDEFDTQDVVEAFFSLFPELQEGKHWVYNDNPNYYSNAIWVECGASGKGSFEATYKLRISDLTKFLTSTELLKAYNESIFTDRKNNYITGTQSTWEMETMRYYYSDHELANIDRQYYKVDNYFELSENPEIVEYWERKDKATGETIKIPKFKINQICGVVLGRNTNKHTVSLLTEYGVVPVKLQKGAFTHYDKRISMTDEETGETKVVESGWFKPGSLLFVRGIRNGDQFRAKVYKNGLYEHTIERIDKVYEDGIVLTTKERTRVD